jgi:hypothetical protein
MTNRPPGIVGVGWQGDRMALDDQALTWHLAYQRGVLSRAQASGCGVTDSALRYRLRRGGPWQRLLPGVYLTATGQPTWAQRQIAALLHAGSDGVITGPAALLNYELQRKVPGIVDVLVPPERQRASAGFVRLHRTRRMPTSPVCDGPIRYAPPERAVADAARALADQVAARAVWPARSSAAGARSGSSPPSSGTARSAARRISAPCWRRSSPASGRSPKATCAG